MSEQHPSTISEAPLISKTFPFPSPRSKTSLVILFLDEEKGYLTKSSLSFGVY